MASEPFSELITLLVELAAANTQPIKTDGSRSMLAAAIYARFSTDNQKPTSIEDQVRRCREHAERLNYAVPDDLIFSDAAMSGQAKAVAGRDGYQALLSAMRQRRMSVVIVDELCRVARDLRELTDFQTLIEETQIRFITTDGLDSNTASWKLQYNLSAVISAHFIEQTRHRVTRGMVGGLDRGGMVGYPAFGYEAKQVLDECGERTKTIWQIKQPEASIVVEVFEMRKRGRSLSSIAKDLNRRGIKPPRKARTGVAYWRPGTVFQMLRKTIYRGVAQWNGSDYSRFKAKKTGRVLEVLDFARPELRLVDDLTWFACNTKTVSRTGRGGGRHVFAGLFECAICHATLTVAHNGHVPSLYCAQCSQAHWVGVESKKSGYVSTNGVRAMLIYAIKNLFTDETIEDFRGQLRRRLSEGDPHELQDAQRALAHSDASCKRLARVLREVGGNDAALEDAKNMHGNSYRQRLSTLK